MKWMYHRRIIVYVVSGPFALQEVTETWYTNVKRVLGTWSAALPYLAIHDISGANFSATPYLMACVRELYSLRDDVQQKVGIVMPRTITAQLIRMLVRGRERENSQTQMFMTREKAVDWLLADQDGGTAE
jgi:hypothetical protein